MLKTTRSPDKPAPSRNDGSRSVSSKNNDSKPASGRNNANGRVDKFGSNSVKHAKKSGKLKSQNLAKSQKLAKSWKLSKSGKSKGKKSKNSLKS